MPPSAPSCPGRCQRRCCRTSTGLRKASASRTRRLRRWRRPLALTSPCHRSMQLDRPGPPLPALD
eukprot:6395148-Lingulodinium_polyedra.AAC.1